MVSLPALLAEAPHIPYKLQLSLESCDPPHPPAPPFTTTTTTSTPRAHLVISRERYGWRYEQVEWKHLGGYFGSCDFYLGGRR